MMRCRGWRCVAPGQQTSAQTQGARSAWLAEAAEEAKRHQVALAAIADFEAEFGGFTDIEMAEAPIVLDAGALVAADRGDRQFWADFAVATAERRPW
jgi:hypothetical protein